MSSGMVFDIQRFALHDGPGIRTTVFLKGCPLRCVWCHNPESQHHHIQYSFDYEKCHACLMEGHLCQSGVERVMVANANTYIPEHDRSKMTEECDLECPKQAIKKIGQLESVDQILKEVEEDRDYYEHTGGGLTLSGGEPVAQLSFALELARRAKNKGIHVCLDTCGYVPQEAYEKLLPWVNMFLYDYKETDPLKHAELTGVRNERILANLDFLYHKGACILLRCPLVPGINDSISHLRGIADLSRKYPALSGINLMPYHDMGSHKAERIGQRSALKGVKSAEVEAIHLWMSTLTDMGCKVTLG